MKKKCLSCGTHFTLSGSGKRQKYCSRCARRGMGQGRGLSGSKQLKTKAAKTASEVDEVLSYYRKSRGRQVNRSASPLPTATGSESGLRIARTEKGEEVCWRVHLKKRLRQKCCSFSEPSEATSDIIRIEGNSRVPLTRLKPNSPARDPNSVQPDIWPRPWGYKVRLYIEAEKELQKLGCGWRNIMVELGSS